jgi:hypothetical protein
VAVTVEKGIYFLENVCTSVLNVVMKGIEPVILHWWAVQDDQKVSVVHLMITIQKVTSNVQSVPHQSPDIY